MTVTVAGRQRMTVTGSTGSGEGVMGSMALVSTTAVDGPQPAAGSVAVPEPIGTDAATLAGWAPAGCRARSRARECHGHEHVLGAVVGTRVVVAGGNGAGDDAAIEGVVQRRLHREPTLNVPPGPYGVVSPVA